MQSLIPSLVRRSLVGQLVGTWRNWQTFALVAIGGCGAACRGIADWACGGMVSVRHGSAFCGG
jgi:hypothetical protein